MAGKMSKRGRYEKCVQAIIDAQESGNPRRLKDAYTYTIGVAKQFPTIDDLSSLLSFWFTQIDSQPWIVEIIQQPYIESGKYQVSDLDEEETPKPARKLVFKDNGL